MSAIGVSFIQIMQKLKFLASFMRKVVLNSQVNMVRYFSATQSSVQNNNKVANITKTNKILSENEMVHIVTKNGLLKYPWLWLRDNCQCKLCFNPQMQSRTIDWKYFDISTHPKSFSINNEVVDIVWSDEHKSQYSFNWLQEREFNTNLQHQWLQNVYRQPKIPWNAENFNEIFQRFNYKNIIESDDHLLQWLESLATFGIAVIEDTPSREDQLRKLANRIAFIKKTHYGDEFVVRNKPDTTNLAYLAIPLQMHTDMPYYDYKPGVNMLHCLKQTTKGGENQFTDCLYLTELLKKTQPETFKILSSVLVDWSDIGEEKGEQFHTIYRAPVLCVDKCGKFVRVNYNQWQRDSHFTVSLEDAQSWYKANAIFTQAMYNSKNMVQMKMNPGEIITFDNIRLVHGRSGYTDSADNERHIIGCYLDWDIVYSRIRVLKKQNLSQSNH